MGELIEPMVFRQWQVVINHNKNVERVNELRTQRNVLALNRVSFQDHLKFRFLETEMAQIDLFDSFLLDMNQIKR
jgi:hypothetical protein